MRVYALLSHFDEQPEHLTACVESLAGFADHLIAVDGAYASFPNARGWSGPEQSHAIRQAADRAGLQCVTWSSIHPWQGGEVEKRGAMFERGRWAGATPEDWFLIIDADMTLADATPEARGLLEATDVDTAVVNWHDIGPRDGLPFSTTKFRSLFRAVPGLTVEHTHWLYVTHTNPECVDGIVTASECCGEYAIETLDERVCCGYPVQHVEPCSANNCRRFLWHTPDGHPSNEPALDLSEHITLHHRRQFRDPERNERAGTYYRERDAAGLEKPQ